jgi:TM2 domain-containing membrane protein YozV
MSPTVQQKAYRAPYFAAFLAWLVPGAGHLYLGCRMKAAIFFVVIHGTFVAGMALGNWRILEIPHGVTDANFWVFLGQLCTGIATAMFHVVRNVMPGDAPFSKLTDVARLYSYTAGLLNLLVVFDAFTRASRYNESGTAASETSRKGKAP